MKGTTNCRDNLIGCNLMSITCTIYSLQRSGNLYKGDYNKMHSSEHKTINAYFACPTKIGVGHTILNQWYPTKIYGT